MSMKRPTRHPIFPSLYPQEQVIGIRGPVASSDDQPGSPRKRNLLIDSPFEFLGFPKKYPVIQDHPGGGIY